MKQRPDGSNFNTEQLRHNGKFIKQRFPLTSLDVSVMLASGYTREEAQRASNQLNIKIQERIESGESESAVMREMSQVWDTSQGKFIDAPKKVDEAFEREIAMLFSEAEMRNLRMSFPEE